jgi:outer membrane receptor protein involved in Fe transport
MILLKKIFYLSLLISSSFYAQESIVTGVVKDGSFNDVIPFATIVVKDTKISAVTDIDGVYQIKLNPGKYTFVFSFIGYNSLTISDVEVKENSIERVNASLSSIENTLKEVVVKSTAKRNTEVSILNLQKKSINVVDGISIETLNKTGASNLAAAVKSIPGVSIVGEKYVVVRGLSDRYTKSILNGMDVPGLDPERNTLQMDVFPKDILDNVLVVKTVNANLDADFTGGMVNIITKDFPTKAQYSFSLGTSYNPKMHFNDKYLTSKTSSTDFLGFDNGLRDLPINVKTIIPFPYEGNSKLTTITSQFNAELKAKQQNSFNDFNFGFSAGNQFSVGDNKLGYIAAITYKNETSFFENYERGNYLKFEDKNATRLELAEKQIGDLGNNNVIISALGGLAYKTKNSKYKLNLLHIQNGESSAAYFDKTVLFSNNLNVFLDVIEYTQRNVSNIHLSGLHSVSESKWRTEWNIAQTFSEIQDKDIRVTPFEYNNIDNIYQITASGGGSPKRIWRNLNESNSVAKVDFTKKHKLFSNDSKLQFGVKGSLKNRDFRIDQYSVLMIDNSNGLAFNGDSNKILSPENIWNNTSNSGTYINGNYQPSNIYNAYSTNYAGYVSDEFNFNEKLKTVIGLRVEKYDLFYTGQNNAGTLKYNDEKTIDKLDIFPSTNIIYSVTDDTNLRFSYSISTARPSFKESSISQIYDPISGLTYNGNLNLKPSYINNYDVRFENYGKGNQMFAVSGFYKTFKDPIELTFYSGAAPTNTQHRNIGEATVYGVEFEYRKDLDFIGLRNFNFNVNTSVIKSVQQMDKTPNGEYDTKLAGLRTGETMKDTRKLQGQSPYLVNGTLSYENKKFNFDANLSYNVQGETLEVVGIAGIPDVYTLPFHSLGFNMSKKLGEEKNSTVRFSISNILNDERESVYRVYNTQSEIFSKKIPFQSFSLSYSYKF